MFAPDRRQRRSEPGRRDRARRFHGELMSEAPIFEKIALIGVGLIGSSIARASRRANLAGHIAGYAPRPETRARAEKMRFADSLHAELGPAGGEAALGGVLAPVGAQSPTPGTLCAH